MMYSFMTLGDGTEVVHSGILCQNGVKEVKVYFEKPINGGFCSACCYLPGYRWEENVGFSDDDIGKHTEYLKSVAHLIFRVAEQR